MKYFLVAGEASGDLHASNLMRSLKTLDKSAEFRYFGGDLMQAVGGTLVKHYRDLAYMGFIPVLLHLRTIFRNLKLCKKSIADFQPDVVILIDYPGFNLKIAKAVHRAPRTVYYISPKIWAWKTYRIRDIKKYIDKMLCIFPFEVDFYNNYDYAVEYVGNPTVDEIAEYTEVNHLEQKPIIALLAGSRRQEIKDNLPVMLEAAGAFPDYQLVIAGAPGIEPEYYKQFTENQKVSIVFGQTYQLLQQSRAALVTSGTATLETALLRIPQVVCYQTPVKHLVTFVWKHFFKVKYISLVNLIAGKTVVQELFGQYFSVGQIRAELDKLLNDENYRETLQIGYQEVIDHLGAPGASEKAARAIVG
ncbi:lipid-A-disaccharide synthase [Bacteroidia bacterium]|nr:lipid-A-disaccharide synthase [Bacteroidia bacterium]